MRSRVVLPTPFSPIKHIFSPLLISNLTSLKSCFSPKLLDSSSVMITSLPLLKSASNDSFSSACLSDGLSSTSICASLFSLDCALLTRCSVLCCLNLRIISSCLAISFCCFSYSRLITSSRSLRFTRYSE